MTPANELLAVVLGSVVLFVVFFAYLMQPQKEQHMSTSTTLEVIIVAVLSILGFAALLGIFATISAAVLYLAWNAFMPAVFGARDITFIQAFALTFLIGAIKGLFSVTVNKKDA